MIDMHADGTGKVAGLLETVAARALNPEPAFEATVDRLIVAEKRLFGGSGPGLKTKPDAPSTVQRKRRSKDARVRSNAENALRGTGALERALTTKGPGGQPVKLTSDELLFGIPGGRHDLHYARYQVKHGRNPLVSASTVRRYAAGELSDFLVRHGE